MKNFLFGIFVMLSVISAMADITLPPVGSSSNNPAPVIYVIGTNGAPLAIAAEDVYRWNSGAAGISGTNGLNGTNGVNGVDGTNGINGINGVNGTNGADGAIGPRGIQGIQGVAGTNGTNGINGVNGTNGTNGTNGVNGTNGLNGVDAPVYVMTNLTYSGTNISFSCENIKAWRVTLTNDAYLNAPTNALDGQVLKWWIRQGTGTNLLSLAPEYILPTGTTNLTLSTEVGNQDLLIGEYDSISNKVHLTGLMLFAE